VLSGSRDACDDREEEKVMAVGDREFFEKHRKLCAKTGCKVGVSYYATDQRAKYQHLCWKHAPEDMDDLPEYYVVIPF
jgi:hypothetical protein